jgi:hypothetical protein
MANPKGNLSTLTPYSPKWKSGPTQTVRIPIALANQVLAYARSLDSGQTSSAQSINTESLLQVIQKLEQLLDTPRNNFSRDRRDLLRSAVDELKALVTVNS